MASECAYLTSCLRLSSSPSSAHRNCSTRSPGIVSTTSRSSSCGPKFARLFGSVSLKRARNITINWRAFPWLAPQIHRACRRDFSRHIQLETRQRIKTRTAMSGLSARTYSWGGEGSLLGRGGESSLGSRLGFRSTLWKNFRMPFCRSN